MSTRMDRRSPAFHVLDLNSPSLRNFLLLIRIPHV
jgi:hypothetical protein